MDTNSTLRLLTSRESEIASLIADGHTNAEIAERLGISFWTAKWHVSEIITKLGVDSREEVAEAWKREHSLRGRLRRAPAGILGAFSLKPMVPVLAGTAMTFVGVFVAFAYAGGAGQGSRGRDDDPAPQVQATISSTAIPTSIAPRDVPAVYVVQPGDTCASIAATFGLQEWALKARNRINDACTNLVVGQQLRLGMPGPNSTDSTNFVRLADLDGDPAKGHLSGYIDPTEGLLVRLVDVSGGEISSSSGQSSFRDWEFYIAGAGTGDGIGGTIAVVASERVARFDLVVDGGAPVPFTPEVAPAALGYPLRVLYVTAPPGSVWEFWGYDDAGNYLGTVAHGSALGAGETYVVKSAPGGATPTPPGPRPEPLDAMSNGHVLSISPFDGALVPREETAAPLDPHMRTGVCAEISEVGRGPDVRLEDVEFRVDDKDVTLEMNVYFQGDPETATTATLCYAPASGLEPGRHFVEIRLPSPGSSSYLGMVWWQFEVAPPPTP